MKNDVILNFNFLIDNFEIKNNKYFTRLMKKRIYRYGDNKKITL